jgi:hypothetical protein
MTQLAWMQLCETAFLDNCDRLCVIGVTTRFAVPTLPIAVHRLTLVARIVNASAGEAIDVGMSVTTPSGLSPSPKDPECVDIANAGEYVLVTLREFPLFEEGVYRFAISLVSGGTLTLDIPVLLTSRPAQIPVH